MLEKAGGRGWRFLEVGAVLVWAAAGCNALDDGATPVARTRVVRPQAETERIMRPLSAAPDTHPAPDTAMAPGDGLAVDLRLLVITADGTDSSLDAITQTLDYLGTPYDVLNASTGPTLTPDYLAVGDHGRYYGVVLDTGDLASGNLSAFSPDEWMTLASYEARFGVRRAVMYAYPTGDYGLTSTGGFDVSMQPITAHCTAAGTAAFAGVNCAAPVAITDGWAYSSQPTDAATVPLLVDDAGTVYAATRSYPDGREGLVMTFAQSATSLHTLQLATSVVDWVTRGLYLGEHHVYLTPQIDDFFLASKLYGDTAGIYRITDVELQAFTDWQSARQAEPLTAAFRVQFAFNAFGAKAPGRDPLTDKALALGPTFGWLNHTWDHAEMDAMSYTDAFQELTQNNQYGMGSGLSRYTVANLVTPSMTGLNNGEAMRAAFDVGIRQVISDASALCEANPSPNTGYYNPQNPALFQVPRHPTDLYFNVSQPPEWVTEYQALHMNPSITYEQMLDVESTAQARFMLRGDLDPWMFHQANLRDIGGGQSLLSAFLDAALAKYSARATFPVMSVAMEDIAQKMQSRMAYNGSGVAATIGPGPTLTISVVKAAVVPVTGLCTPSAETYGTRQISYVPLADGQSVTLSLADCNANVGWAGAPVVPPSAGTPTMGGNCPTGGAGGSSGTGGDTGSGGAGGSTMGNLSTDGGTDPGAYGNGNGSNGCACAVSGGARGGAALGGLLAAVAIAVAMGRGRRRRGPTQAS